MSHIAHQALHARPHLPTLPALTALSALILLSACGGSSRSEAPSAAAQGESPTAVSGIAQEMAQETVGQADGTAASPGAAIAAPGAPASPGAAPSLLADPNPALQDGSNPITDPGTVPAVPASPGTPTDGAIVGAPGMPVDCASSLPCRWFSADSGVGITASSIDHLGTQGELTIDFSIEATRDTAFTFAGAGAIVAPTGETADVQRVTLGQGNGVAPVSAIAGQSLIGRIAYDSRVEQATLPSWSLTLAEAGQSLDARFANLPVAVPVGVDVDCAGTLPCTWQTSDAGVLLTLTRVGGFTTARRLDIAFQLQSTTARSIAMDAGSSARATSGFVYSARTHRLGTASGFGPISVQAVPGEPLNGSVDFFRATTVTDTLSEVQLEIFEDGPVPRWRPRFTNVPSIAP